MQLDELQKYVGVHLPVRDVVLFRYQDSLGHAMQFVAKFVDEFGDAHSVDAIFLEETDFNLYTTEDELALKVVKTLNERMTKKWLRTRYDAWHIDALGPDSLEEYIGMTADQYGELENTGEYPEGWRIPE